MPARHRPSPCCGARSIVRLLSLKHGRIALRCAKCGVLRIELLAPPAPTLRLVEITRP